MTSKVTWSDTNKALSDDEITQVEERLGIKFPKDYLEVVMKNDGGYPEPSSFTVKSSEESFNNLISFNPDDYSYILDVIEDVSDRLLDKIIPFGEDPGGNLICFDYRTNEVPTIVFWDHEIAGGGELERAISFVCDTFTEFLSMLHEPIDE